MFFAAADRARCPQCGESSWIELQTKATAATRSQSTTQPDSSDRPTRTPGAIGSHGAKEVGLYTDGSCWGNPGPGGWAAILVYKHTKREFTGSEKQSTRGRMELLPVIEGLRRLNERCHVSVECDAQYVVRAFKDNWIQGWLRRDWRKKDGTPVLNPELWRELLDEVARHDVRWTWVRGHAGNLYDERCHELAVQACKAAIPDGWASKRRRT